MMLDFKMFDVLNKIMPCPFTGLKMFGLVQIFCARPKIYLHFVAVTKRQKDDLHSIELVFVLARKFLKRH